MNNTKNKVDLSNLVVCVDFDGTVCTHEFPKVGREIGAPPVLKRLTDAGAKLILWTMRSDNRTDPKARNGIPMENPNPLTDAVNWFKQHGIPLYGIQRNPTQDKWTSSPKAYANLYIDDAGINCPLVKPADGSRPYVDWTAIETILFPAP